MLKLLSRILLFTIWLPMAACAEADAPYKEGEHYVELPSAVATDDETKIEVVELFWYGCPHCYMLEPQVKKWVAGRAQDVTFKRMPAVFSSRWEVHARAYYAADVLGVLEKTHEPLFSAIHRQRQKLFDQQSLAAFYASHGVKPEDFNKTYKSFAVNGKIQQVKAAQKKYRATGVPAIIVNGKYRVSPTMKAGQNGLFDVVDYLIAKERAAIR